MKNLITILFLFAGTIANSQSAFSVLSSHGSQSASRASAKNAWLGAGLVYNIKDDVSQNFVLNGSFLAPAYTFDRGAIPIMGNIELDSTGIFDVGIFPYYSLSFTGTVQVLLHGGIAYKFLIDRPDTENEYLLTAGIEAAFYGDNGRAPFTLSIAPELIGSFNQSNERSGLNITGILPLYNGMGLLAEGLIPFDGDATTGLKIGIIVNSALK
jgi:hypothetical protein